MELRVAEGRGRMRGFIRNSTLQNSIICAIFIVGEKEMRPSDGRSKSAGSISARPTRRDFVKKALLGAALAPQALQTVKAAVSAPAPEGFAAPKTFLEPFNYDGVRLLDGRLKSQYSAARDYFYAIPSDDMLRGFRIGAGLTAPGNDLGGWYSGDPRVKYWWSAATPSTPLDSGSAPWRACPGLPVMRQWARRPLTS